MAGVAVMGSDARAWTITSGTGCTSDFNIITLLSGAGLEWSPGSYQAICEDNIANTGTSEGVVSAVFCELDSGGSIVRELCSRTITLAPGSYAVLEFDETIPTCSLAPAAVSDIGTIGVYIPPIANTQAYYGLKTWGEHEVEPVFPAPSPILGLRRAAFPSGTKRWAIVAGAALGATALGAYLLTR